MKPLHWTGENDFLLDGVRFLCGQGNYSLKSNKDRLVLLKDREILDKYASEFGVEPIKSIVEFGIFQGGSPALFTLWFELEKFVGIDVSAPIPEFDEFVMNHERGNRIRTHYGVSQADRSGVERIIRDEFGTTPIDMIIDDASHRYSTTRKAFEIGFPWLRPGGSYVIEDWGWAHWAGFDNYPGETALSKLVMELIMLCASRNDIVSEVRVFPWFVVVKKSPRAPQLNGMKLDSLIHRHGIELVGTKDLNLLGVAKLVMSRLANSIRRR